LTSTETRADRFIRELAELKIPDPADRLPDQGVSDLTGSNSSPR
jgi:hypothetical protein